MGSFPDTDIDPGSVHGQYHVVVAQGIPSPATAGSSQKVFIQWAFT